jgi:hypothetical protein
MVEKEPKFETRVTDRGVDSLTSCLTEGLYKIPDVGTSATVIDIQKKPAFIVFLVLKVQQPFEHVLR